MTSPRLHGLEEALRSRNPALRVGVDLVELDEVAASLATFGDRYLERIYAPGELAYCRAAAGDPTPHLAARFAAKEAAVKVLRPSATDDGIDWRTIEVVRTPGGAGWCHLVLSGAAARLAERQALSDFQVTLSHAPNYAVAVVVAASRDPGAQDS
jgi:holo-[acyl-carrier protein] synthase